MASIVGKYKCLGAVENLARRGRPRKITPRSERKILRIIEKKYPDNLQRISIVDLLVSRKSFTLP